MGQQYIGAALLNKFEGMYVANFDLQSIYKDSTRSAEAAVVQMFEEVKRHKPSVIYIPQVNIWYESLQDSVIKTFTGMLRSLPPTDPILVLGIMEQAGEHDEPNKSMMRDLFGYSAGNTYELKRPDQLARQNYFAPVLDYIKQSPLEFPDPDNRKKREIPKLPEAPIESEKPKEQTKAELKEQKKSDRHVLNMLKIALQPIMDEMKRTYKRFRNPPVDERAFAYLFDEQDPDILTTDLGEEEAAQHMHRPYRLDHDKKGVRGILEVATGKFYYNLELVTIEVRLSNGYYKRTKDFLADIKRLLKDAKTSGDQERILKANELYANVEVDLLTIEKNNPATVAACEALYKRELAREEEEKQRAREAGRVPPPSNVPPNDSGPSESTIGPIRFGIDVPTGLQSMRPMTPTKSVLSNGVSGNGDGSHDRSNGSAHSHERSDIDMVGGRDTSGTHPPFDPAAIPHADSASTTTKTSDRSSAHTGTTNRTSNGYGVNYSIYEPPGASQLADTQEQTAESSSPSGDGTSAAPTTTHTQTQHTQPMGPPPARRISAASPSQRADLDAILNHPAPTTMDTTIATTRPSGMTSAAAAAPMLIPPSPETLSNLTLQLATKSSGLSVEQLEQVMAQLMRRLWATRREWNRNVVAGGVSEAFNWAVGDIEGVQSVLGATPWDG